MRMAGGTACGERWLSQARRGRAGQEPCYQARRTRWRGVDVGVGVDVGRADDAAGGRRNKHDFLTSRGGPRRAYRETLGRGPPQMGGMRCPPRNPRITPAVSPAAWSVSMALRAV